MEKKIGTKMYPKSDFVAIKNLGILTFGRMLKISGLKIAKAIES